MRPAFKGNNERMNFIVTGVISGVLGTLAMDLLNQVFSRTGLLLKIDMGVIGRMAAGWVNGRFRYNNPSEMKQVSNERLYGHIAHYAIGISLALPFVFGWDLWVGGPVSPAWALVYGVGTTAASWFLVYPSMGFGVFGRMSPDGMKAALSSLANHLFYGVGLAAGISVSSSFV